MIECALDVMMIRCDQETISILPLINTIDIGQAVQRKMQFRGITLTTHMVNAMCKAGFDVTC